MTKVVIEERPECRRWAAPADLRQEPIHRWYVFPHSFTSKLVHGLIAEWGLGKEDRIIDPFVGAGTTLLAAKEMCVPATGYDLSPLAVLASRVKTANLRAKRLEEAWDQLQGLVRLRPLATTNESYPQLIRDSFSRTALARLDAVKSEIEVLRVSRIARDFFLLALLAVLPQFSRAVATGGWLKWVRRPTSISRLPTVLEQRVRLMINDLRQVTLPWGPVWDAKLADARCLPEPCESCSAIITSPPYPNRHDYTRVFGVELMFAFLDWDQTRAIRYQSFHSHPEAKPKRHSAKGYIAPPRLLQALRSMARKGENPRVLSLLEGYFLDAHLCLHEARRICRTGGRVAFVVGNAQYSGVPVIVDELVAELGEKVGLSCDCLRAIRYRGNSAQQMGRHGRRPSRESIVIFHKPQEVTTASTGAKCPGTPNMSIGLPGLRGGVKRIGGLWQCACRGLTDTC